MSDTTAVADDQRRLRVLLGVLGAVAVLALLWFFVITPLLLGDDSADTATDQPTTAVPAPTETLDPDPEVDEPDVALLPVETYEIFLSRDPFDPVVPEPATDGDGTTDADGDGVPDGDQDDQDGDGVPDDDQDGDGVPDDDDGVVDHNAVLIDVFTDDSGQPRALIRVDDRIFTVGEGDIFDGFTVVAIDGTCVTLSFEGSIFTLCEGGGGTGDPDGGTDGDDTGACRGQEEVVCDGRVVTLIDVFVGSDGTPVAVVQVDSTLYEVRRGDSFAQNFQVISIDPPCVTLLFGDDAFTLCEGQRTLK